MSPLWPALLAFGAFLVGLSVGWYICGHPDRRPTPDAGLSLVAPPERHRGAGLSRHLNVGTAHIPSLGKTSE